MTAGDALPERLEAVRRGIADAAAEAGRSADEISLIVVTKFHPPGLVRDLFALGVTDFGENRHQEAQAKAAELADLDLTWHFIGQLQSKKARQVRAYASVIHSLDRDSVVDALASADSVVDCFVQLNLTDDPARGGVRDADLEALTERVLSTSGLRLLGVMAVAPVGEEPRAAFARVRAASERVRVVAPAASYISAGMSGDYREAVLEGATHLRIGSAITGNRPTAG
ncbi:YggS family pyridoxal phosphate-dependent enzyme [Lacisediminihabitans sp.]|jgi:pyridoxal phosphate enzyme (YggS family)|uniref:YggS family pyridoxal phosphate-dependent enzyme n=1 Tax=Lacisediminihabitans sp. TaxID=2787631 RepID=UPI002F93BF10